MNWSKLKKEQLKVMCEEQGLDPSGTKDVLIDRLKAHEKESESHKDDVDGQNVNDDAEGSAAEEEENEDSDDDDGQSQSGSVSSRLKLFKAEQETLRLKLELAKLKAGKVGNASSPEFDSWKMKKLPAMGESEDPLSFFLNFEKLCRLNSVPLGKYAACLPGLLNTTMRSHYSRLDYETSASYQATKEALLKACRLSPRSYLEKFRSVYRTGSETYSEFLNRLRDNYSLYLEVSHIDGFDALKEANIMEQFRSKLPSEIKHFVDTRQPSSALEMASLAELAYDCSKDSLAGKKDFKVKQGHHRQTDEVKLDEVQVTNVNMPVNDTNAANASASIKRDVICYTCNEVGHTSKFHRANNQRVKTTQSKKVVNVNGPMDEIENYEQTHFIIPCYLFDREVCAIRDSGSQMTLVASEFIDQGTAIRQPVPVQCGFGTIRPVYLTEIKIRSPRFGTDEVTTVKAGVVDGLSPPLVLGHDIFVQNKNLIDPVVPNKAGIQSVPNEVIREVTVATRKNRLCTRSPAPDLRIKSRRR